MNEGNFPVRALPDLRSRRLAFGMEVTRKVSKAGIVVMGVHYQSDDLISFWLMPGSKTVKVRWDPENLGAIEVHLDGAWREVKAVHERFEGVNLHVWVQARKALRAKSASRKAWEEEIVYKAIDDIEALVREKSVAFGLIDTSISDARLKHLEATLFSGFTTVPDRRLQSDGQDMGQIITPKPPSFDRTHALEPNAAQAVDLGQPTAGSPGKAVRRPNSPSQAPKPASKATWLPRALDEDQ
ncbi:Mu transposase C-terminal domain-containing protein [Tranquillimonas alkanivorans]|uniref:Mu transposase, C-terminal n=1 Tax=Tranquillimonas alkanivorans TaxID=441119 RepID=A0A1I5WVJ7_9RHOB|nr:Mu transposase C-terminal domain-containing protein [Tranquillimonas alkanivorans]SFQ23536.1 Mu transposase, C-terminal [Tranquillimonas alkanivorans]